MNTPMIDRLVQRREFLFSADQVALIEEIRAILAERDALRTENATLQAMPTPPRRLREYVASGGQYYRCIGGRLEWKQSSQAPWVAVRTVYVNDVPALADLIANPEEQAETIYDVIQRFAAEHGVKTITGMAMYEQRFREAAANNQPQPVSVPYTLPITPEQAVSVLVEGGAKLEQVMYRATVGSTHMTAGTRILILPIATPEGGK